MKIFKGCNLFAMLFFLLLCFFILYIVRDENTLIKSFQDRFYQEYTFNEPIDLSTVEKEINEQINNIGDNQITVKDYHIRSFLSKKFNTKYIDAKIYNDSISIIISLDNKDGKHFLLEANFIKEKKDLLLNKIFILNYQIPKFLNVFFTDNFKRVSNLNHQDSDSILRLIIPINLEITNWEIKNKQIVLDVKFIPSIF